MCTDHILDQLKKLRKVRGYTQSGMADQLNISLKAYQNIEYGVTKIDLERLGKILQVFDTNLEAFFGQNKVSTNSSTDLFLYEKLLEERNRYIEKLEREVLYYQKILENRLYL